MEAGRPRPAGQARQVCVATKTHSEEVE